MTFTLLIITAFIVWFSSVWIAVLSLLSFIGGWKSLSVLHPITLSDKDESTVRYSMSSIKMGFINYRSCVFISLTKTGIILEMLKIFSTMHKPVFIPYSRMSDIQQVKALPACTSITVDDKKVLVYGKAGEELFSRLSSRDNSL